MMISALDPLFLGDASTWEILLIVILKTIALRTGDPHFDRSAKFWGKIFAVNFVMGVVTGIPMEFQFGTNWAEFSDAAGGVIG